MGFPAHVKNPRPAHRLLGDFLVGGFLGVQKHHHNNLFLIPCQKPSTKKNDKKCNASFSSMFWFYRILGVSQQGVQKPHKICFAKNPCKK
jgi:hypothetical protein